MTALKPKTARRASADERKRLAHWVSMYRQAQAAPDRRYCVNPQDEPENQYFIHADDPEPLLLLLEDFVRHGTFALVDDPARAMVMRREFTELRAQGITREKALAVLGEKHHCDPSTVKRAMARKN
jgi:hypothetical protein